MQWNETSQQWTDITTHVDTENNIIHGETTHLSKFAIMLSVPVGGVWFPVNKLALLAPYIGLASTIILAIAVTAIFFKYKKKK